MADTRASRYIASSDSLQMQADATQQIGQAAAQSVQRIQQGQQQYFQGVIQNNNAIATMQQQLAQVELAGASKPSPLSQLAEGAVKGLEENYRERQLKDKALKEAKIKQASVDADNRKNTQLTKFTAALGDLTDYYESSNWKDGESQYKKDAIAIIQNLPPDADPEVKKKLIEGIYQNTQARSRKVGENVVKETEALRDGKFDSEKAKLQFNLTAIVGSITTQSTDEQAAPYLKQAQDILRDFLNTDNGLPQGKKLSIVASAMDSVNAAYSKKYARYSERTEKLQDWVSYAQKYKEIDALEATGQLSYDDARNQQQLLDVQYPDFKGTTVQRGDKERRDLALSQVVEAQRKLSEEAGVRAVTNFRFTDDTVRASIAGAFFDPSFYNTLKTDPTYKDNPQLQEIVKGVDRLQDYYKQENQVILAQSQAATEFQKLDFSNLQTLTSLNRSIALRQASGKELSATEQIAQLQINQMKQANPELAASLELSSQGKPIPQIDQNLIAQTLLQERAVTENIKKTIVQEVQAKRAALYSEFTDLQKYGFLGQTQDTLRTFAKNSASFYEKELESLNRARQEAIQQQQPSNQYGLQPNFNSSSTYATSLDDQGKVKVVPRARTQLIRLPDNSSIITPIIAGDAAPVTSHWKDTRPGGRKHAGVDFGASNGSKAVALVPGQIVYVGVDPSGYGGYVDLLGDNGVVYRYGHQAAQVKVGQRVNAGDVVSVSDGSGAGAPHLHFEVRPTPGFTNGKYDVSKNFGVQGTVEVLDHLRKLTAKNSNVLTPRFNSSTYRTAPNQKVPINSTLSNRGGAVNGSTYQRIGGVPGNSKARIDGQRPLGHSQAPYKINAGQVSYDYNDNLGYAELAKDSRARKAFVDTAKELGVPTEWIVDIARQEAGSLYPYVDHHSANGNYGLFGFGSDSFNDPNIHKRLRAGQIDTEGQLKLYTQYMKENGWDSIVKQKRGAVSVADLWALTRFGTKLRNKFIQTGDVNIKTEGTLKYSDELQLLGKWAGRSYSLPGSRSSRNKAVSQRQSSTCKTCAQLALSNTFLPHIHG